MALVNEDTYPYTHPICPILYTTTISDSRKLIIIIYIKQHFTRKLPKKETQPCGQATGLGKYGVEKNYDIPEYPGKLFQVTEVVAIFYGFQAQVNEANYSFNVLLLHHFYGGVHVPQRKRNKRRRYAGA